MFAIDGQSSHTEQSGNRLKNPESYHQFGVRNPELGSSRKRPFTVHHRRRVYSTLWFESFACKMLPVCERCRLKGKFVYPQSHWRRIRKQTIERFRFKSN